MVLRFGGIGIPFYLAKKNRLHIARRLRHRCIPPIATYCKETTSSFHSANRLHIARRYVIVAFRQQSTYCKETTSSLHSANRLCFLHFSYANFCSSCLPPHLPSKLYEIRLPFSYDLTDNILVSFQTICRHSTAVELIPCLLYTSRCV